MYKRISILFVLLICTIMTSCNKGTTEIPEDVLNLFDTYMSAYEMGVEESVKYAHFESDVIRKAYLESGDKLLDYEVEDIEKINDNLYAFTILVKTMQTNDAYLRAYNFVALIDNTWRYTNHVDHIPAYLKDNLDEKKYSYGFGLGSGLDDEGLS